MAELFIGMAIGAVIGVICMALFCAASDADDKVQQMAKKTWKRKSE